MALRNNKPRQVRTGYEVYTAKSTNSRRDQGQPSRPQAAIKKRLPRVKAGKSARLVLGVIAAIMVIWAFGSTLISSINVAGTTNLSNKEVERLVRSSISRNPWYANYFTSGGLRLDRTLPELEPRIKTATVKKTFPSTLTITIVERQPGVVWVSAGENWEVDIEGIIIGAAGSKKPMATVIDTANIPVKPGDRVAPSRFVRFTQDISEQLSGKTGLGIENFQVPESISEVYVKTNKGYSVKFDTTRSATDQLNDLVLVIKNLNGKVPSQYIDLRVAGRAYYQ
jgi:cell division septal protein FtsQ